MEFFSSALGKLPHFDLSRNGYLPVIKHTRVGWHTGMLKA